MRNTKYLKSTAAAFGVMAIVSNAAAADGGWGGSYGNNAPDPFGARDRYANMSLDAKIQLLRQKVKYVFVIFHENELFDHYFGTFPGVNGLFEAPAGFTPAIQTPSFKQRFLDTSLNTTTTSPFLMPQAVVTTNGQVAPIYPADEISVDHSHQGMANDLDVDPTTRRRGERSLRDGPGRPDHQRQRHIVTPSGARRPRLRSRRSRRPRPTSPISIATRSRSCGAGRRISCSSTISIRRSSVPRRRTPSRSSPASPARRNGRCTRTRARPSPTPTRLPERRRRELRRQLRAGDSNAYVPVVADPGPFPGSNLDKNSVKPPYNFDENPANPALNLTFATQPLSYMGSNIDKIIGPTPTRRRSARRAAGHPRDRRLRQAGAMGLVPAGLQRQRRARSL